MPYGTNPFGRGSWEELTEGTWLPKNPNEHHNVSLFQATYDGFLVEAKRTKDRQKWIAKAHSLPAYAHNKSVDWGKPFRTRERAAWDAINRVKK